MLIFLQKNLAQHEVMACQRLERHITTRSWKNAGNAVFLTDFWLVSCENVEVKPPSVSE